MAPDANCRQDKTKKKGNNGNVSNTTICNADNADDDVGCNSTSVAIPIMVVMEQQSLVMDMEKMVINVIAGKCVNKNDDGGE